MCVNHFRQEDVEYTHKVPNGYVTYREIQRVNPKLKDGSVPVFLPGHPSICSQSIASTKRRRVSPTSKDEEMFNEALTLRLASESEEKEKYQFFCFQDIQAKLPLLSIPKTWSLWYLDYHSLIYMLPLLTEHNIIVKTHILVSFDLQLELIVMEEFYHLQFAQSAIYDTLNQFSVRFLNPLVLFCPLNLFQRPLMRLPKYPSFISSNVSLKTVLYPKTGGGTTSSHRLWHLKHI